MSSTITFRLLIFWTSISSWARRVTIGLIPLTMFIFLSAERQDNIPGRLGSADRRGDLILTVHGGVSLGLLMVAAALSLLTLYLTSWS